MPAGAGIEPCRQSDQWHAVSQQNEVIPIADVDSPYSIGVVRSFRLPDEDAAPLITAGLTVTRGPAGTPPAEHSSVVFYHQLIAKCTLERCAIVWAIARTARAYLDFPDFVRRIRQCLPVIPVGAGAYGRSAG